MNEESKQYGNRKQISHLKKSLSKGQIFIANDFQTIYFNLRYLSHNIFTLKSAQIQRALKILN
jgi:hypothetical protein